MAIFVDVIRTFENDEIIEYRFDSNRGSGWIVYDKQTRRVVLNGHRTAAGERESSSSKGFQ
jgi:hypothetical protein